MNSNAPLVQDLPTIDPPLFQNIPTLLKKIPQWIVWRAGPMNADGKFPKYPINPTTNKTDNAHDSAIWLSFDEVRSAFQTGDFSGIGFVLTDKWVDEDEFGAPLFLIGIDIDAKSGLLERNAVAVKELWIELGKPYLEGSPSGNGFRLFALSRSPVPNGNKGGKEIYSARRFLTVTGHYGQGRVKDCTEEILSLHGRWFTSDEAPSSKTRPVPGKAPTTRSSDTPMLAHLLNTPLPDTPEQRTRVREMLKFINADCSYERWRDIIWAIESTCLVCAEELGQEWSLTAPHRFDEKVFQATRRSFKQDGGIGFGTLVYYARDGGWKEATSPQEAETAPPRFKLLSRNDIDAIPPLEWLIRGVLPKSGIAAIYGPSGSGKSFLIFDAICAIAEGEDWFGAKVNKAPVVYVALEGGRGIRQRVMAWEKMRSQRLPNNFRLVLDQLALNSAKDVTALADQIGTDGMACGVVVIDTLNRAAPDAEENSSRDMGTLIANATLLQQYINGVVVLVHHTGKDAGRGLRGHSSLHGALDAAIEVLRTGGVRQWKLAKTKDGADGAEHAFKLDVVQLGVDQDGEPLTSCVVVPTAQPTTAPKREPQGGHQRIALDVVEGLLIVAGEFGQAGAPAHAPCVKESAALAAVASGLMVADPKRKKERAASAIGGLINRKLLSLSEGWLWRV